MGEACSTHGREGERSFVTKAEGMRPRDGVDWTDRIKDRDNWRARCKVDN